MPPPKAVESGKVAPLSDEDRLTLVRWIDLGCPIDLTNLDGKTEAPVPGWLVDDQRPTLTVTYPQRGKNARLDQILIGMHDVSSGLDMESFTVTLDTPVDGVAAGANLAAKFAKQTDGVWVWKLPKPVTAIDKAVLTVQVKDRQGSQTEIVRTFSVK
jgi:hypothetical protein